MADDRIRPKWDSPESHEDNYPPDWEMRRQAVYNRDDWTCQNCGKSSGPYAEGDGIPLHAHHIVPVSKGGSNKLSNLQTLCETCHNKAHIHDITEETEEHSSRSPSAPSKSGHSANKSGGSDSGTTRASLDSHTQVGNTDIHVSQGTKSRLTPVETTETGPIGETLWYSAVPLVVSFIFVLIADIAGAPEKYIGFEDWIILFGTLATVSIYYGRDNEKWERASFAERDVHWRRITIVIAMSSLALAISLIGYLRGAPYGGFGFIGGLLAYVLVAVLIFGLLFSGIGALMFGSNGVYFGMVIGVVVALYMLVTSGPASGEYPNPYWVSATANYSSALNVGIGLILIAAVLISWGSVIMWLVIQPVRDRINSGYQVLPPVWPAGFAFITLGVMERSLNSWIPVVDLLLIPVILYTLYEFRVQLGNVWHA